MAFHVGGAQRDFFVLDGLFGAFSPAGLRVTLHFTTAVWVKAISLALWVLAASIPAWLICASELRRRTRASSLINRWLLYAIPECSGVGHARAESLEGARALQRGADRDRERKYTLAGGI